MTLRNLLAEPDFGLRLLPVESATAEQLDAEIAWVHSSDLMNPTPWLDGGQLLLTDGGQFAPADGPDAGGQEASGAFAQEAAAYVARLKACGIRGLGFAVNVVHRQVPRAVVAACVEAGLPLVLVPSSTPFIRIIRRVADAIAEDRHERLQWSIRAQRAVARATLRPDGLAATLRELETQLGCWVALFDSIGRRVPVRTQRDVPEEAREELERAVAGALRGGRRSAARLSDRAQAITLQTIGQADRLRGVLAIGTAVPLDPAGSDLVASVVGIASVAIEQGRALDSARRGLRMGVMELYLAGSGEAAARALRDMNAWVPEGIIRVAVARGTQDWTLIVDELELLAADARFVFARVRGDLMVIYPADAEPPLEFVAREGLRAGISAPVTVREIPRAKEDAEHALRRVAEDGGTLEFDRLAENGLLSWLDAADGGVLAERILRRLRARADARELTEALLVWYRHNCAWDPAARELGMHRHTLRSRIKSVEAVTGLDLDVFHDRAELWLALQLAPSP
ncbi:PucR family transcriptional regulator [Gulosibacter sp. 10]|uniref:PucR family transcriptional regulator n=1 Tax=Gulosibacter sp. 10 TaxID=1255570 RepID=UPI000B355911|nr:PucR family transcriptional regulator [Gulosibacter sp. 10]